MRRNVPSTAQQATDRLLQARREIADILSFLTRGDHAQESPASFDTLALIARHAATDAGYLRDEAHEISAKIRREIAEKPKPKTRKNTGKQGVL